MRARFALFATVLLLLSPSAHAQQPSSPPHQIGILCFDGANRGAEVQIQLHRINANYNSKTPYHVAYYSPWLGYYERTSCVRLSDIDIPVGLVLEVHHYSFAQEGTNSRRPCSGGDGNYRIQNDGSNKHVFAQVGGRTLFDSNCTIKTDWQLPAHAHRLVQHNGQAGHPGSPVYAIGILCFDGANRGSQVQVQLHRTGADYKSNAHVAYYSPWLGYYDRTSCERLSELNVPVGVPLEVHHYSYAQEGTNSRRPCTGGDGRYLVVNDNSNQHIFAQVGGHSFFDSNCTMKPDWPLPSHARHLLK